jgi:aminopeptidase-like protein
MSRISSQKKDPEKSLERFESIGEEIYSWAEDLFPICRSISGEGVRETLRYFQKIIPNLTIKEVKSGTQVFDWTVPDEWNIYDAWIKNSKGEKIVDFKNSNLHVVSYSEPVHKKMSLSELNKFLYSLPDQPNAIPYITSYYKRRWGFCLTHNQRKELKDDEYEVYINSTLEPGVLNYGEIVIKGESDQEVLISSNICHPSMANNELSGPTVITAIATWLLSLKKLRYTYRIIYIPETIGSIIYLSKHLDHLKKHVIAGFNVYSVGDDRNYSFISTPDEDTYADQVINHVYKHHTHNKYIKYPFTERGSDERQYCAPGVDLPVVGVCRSRYNLYSEYHTSLDDLTVISPDGLQGGFDILRKTIQVLENNKIFKVNVYCEPQMGKRGLYPNISTKDTVQITRSFMNLIAYSNGKRSMLDIAEKINTYIGDFYPYLEILIESEIISEKEK